MKKLNSTFKRFLKITLNENNLDALNELNLLLISNDVATETADALCDKIKDSLKGQEIGILTSKKKMLFNILRESIEEILTPEEEIDILYEIKQKNTQQKPFVIVFLGVNGTGKTTTIAKIAHFLKNQGITCVAAASDTFRAGAMEQLSYHMENVGVRVIKHEYQSDPASVAYDAIEHATAKGINVVLIDTAGRQVSNKNLMREMEKIVRISQPDLTIFVGDSLAGNDALNQAKEFNRNIGIDANILTKFDADAKGGAALSVSYETKKPILFVGIGQGYDDLEQFNRKVFISNILDIEDELRVARKEFRVQGGLSPKIIESLSPKTLLRWGFFETSKGLSNRLTVLDKMGVNLSVFGPPISHDLQSITLLLDSFTSYKSEPT